VVADDVVVLPWNDLQGCESLVKAHADELGVIILDPSAEGSGVIPPRAGFLEGLKELTERYGIVLLFDEVLTGFRLALGGAQEKYGVTPDLAAFGKAMGGGSPIGAVAGRKDIMELFENKGVKPRVRNSGSFNGYPVSLASSIATLKELKPSVYDQIENNARRLQEQLTQRLAELKLKGCVTRAGGIMHLIHFGIDHLDSFRDAANTDKSMEYQFGLGIMCKGVYMPPFKPCLISAAITKQDIDSALSSMSRVLAELRPTSA
jgi:glutamate-1-semialdehyde 2,1-aminomutase